VSKRKIKSHTIKVSTSVNNEIKEFISQVTNQLSHEHNSGWPSDK